MELNFRHLKATQSFLTSTYVIWVTEEELDAEGVSNSGSDYPLEGEHGEVVSFSSFEMADEAVDQLYSMYGTEVYPDGGKLVRKFRIVDTPRIDVLALSKQI